MIEEIQATLDQIAAQYQDRREQVLQVQMTQLGNNAVSLQGRVLDQATLAALVEGLHDAHPGLTLQTDEVQVLRQPHPRVITVNTNLTGFFDEPSFLAEFLSEQMYGWRLEVLQVQDRWAFVRQMDGYMGWVYLPYMREEPALPPTHIALTPVVQLRAEPRADALPVGRLLGGTSVALLETAGDWARVDMDHPGWVPAAGLRALADLPKTEAERRAQLVQDVIPMIGTPYQWGGCSANGIDCSGLAQLLHRWVGLTIRRDAGMQMEDRPQIEPPFEAGDLVFFGDENLPLAERSITHVGISVGGWKMIHSSRSRNGVYYDDIQQVEHLREGFTGACSYMRDA